MLEIVDAEVVIGGEGFNAAGGAAQLKTWTLY